MTKAQTTKKKRKSINLKPIQSTVLSCCCSRRWYGFLKNIPTLIRVGLESLFSLFCTLVAFLQKMRISILTSIAIKLQLRSLKAVIWRIWNIWGKLLSWKLQIVSLRPLESIVSPLWKDISVLCSLLEPLMSLSHGSTVILFCVFLTFSLLSQSSFTAVVCVFCGGGTCCLFLIFYRNSIASYTQGKHKYMSAHMHCGPKR